MNEVLKKVIEYKRIQHEKMMWERISDIGWGVRTVDYKRLRKELSEKYSMKDIKRTKEFAVAKRKELAKILTEFEKSIGVPNYFNVSDDGFWDLTAHIVGLGKHHYDIIIEKPPIARDIVINNMYKENFEYSFNINNESTF